MPDKLHDHLSYPPRAMRAERAAAYLSISNAAQALAEAGCSVDEIMAITGHRSAKMALHYTKRPARKQLAKNAMLRWEAADAKKARK